MMIRESIAILAVGVVIMFIFLRSRHYGYMLASLPIFLIPIFHMLVRGILYLSRDRFFGIRAPLVTAFADLLGLVVGCVVIGFIAHRIPSKKNRTLYLVVMLVFTLLLGWAYIFNSLRVLLG